MKKQQKKITLTDIMKKFQKLPVNSIQDDGETMAPLQDFSVGL